MQKGRGDIMGYAESARIVAVIRDLRMGFGVEDIAVMGTDTAEFARYVVNRYRMAGLLSELYSGVVTGNESKKTARPARRKPCGIAEIAEAVAREHGITIAQMTSRERNWDVSHPRQVAYLRAHNAGFSMPQIAKWFGYDHTTILHGIRSAMKRNEVQQ